MKLEDSDKKVDLDFEKIVPDANLGLIIDGLAFMYMKDDLLMMRFPKAKDHTLQISIARNGQPYAGFSVPVGSFIEITHNGAIAPAERNNFDDVLNINEFHDGLKLKRGNELQASSRGLSIANAHVEPYGEKTIFEFWKITENENGEQIAKHRLDDDDFKTGIKAVMVGDVVIDTETADPRTKIKVDGEMPFEVSFTYAENIKYVMRISNHCNRPECEFRSDFHHYYKIFDPSTVTNKLDLVSPVDKDDKTGSQSILGNRAPCNIIYSNSNPE